jgi:protein-disulfide isomerase
LPESPVLEPTFPEEREHGSAFVRSTPHAVLAYLHDGPWRLLETHMRTRRQALKLIMLSSLLVGAARAQEGQEYPIHGDDGAPIENFRVPSELDPATLPGIIWKGAQSTAVILYEFMDYNCPYCRKAAREIDAISAKDSDLRIGIVNNAVLSIGSLQAAKVQQGILRLAGPAVAYDFHMRMFGRRGPSDGASAIAVAGEMGLDARKVEESSDNAVVAAVLSRQSQLAASLGMAMTPSFVIAGVGLLGWPGAKTLQSIIANARKCGRPGCDDKG